MGSAGASALAAPNVKTSTEGHRSRPGGGETLPPPRPHPRPRRGARRDQPPCHRQSKQRAPRRLPRQQPGARAGVMKCEGTQLEHRQRVTAASKPSSSTRLGARGTRAAKEDEGTESQLEAKKWRFVQQLVAAQANALVSAASGAGARALLTAYPCSCLPNRRMDRRDVQLSYFHHLPTSHPTILYSDRPPFLVPQYGGAVADFSPRSTKSETNHGSDQSLFERRRGGVDCSSCPPLLQMRRRAGHAGYADHTTRRWVFAAARYLRAAGGGPQTCRAAGCCPQPLPGIRQLLLMSES